MKYDPEKQYGIGYYDPKLDDMIQVHTDSLARAVRAFLVRVKRYPERRVDLTTGPCHEECLAIYRPDEEITYQGILSQQDWQDWIKTIK
jgi:hypothetical protein